MVQPVNGVTLICAWEPCSKTFVAFPSKVKRHAKNYCSRPCADLGTAQARNQRVTVTCAWIPCSQPFEMHRWKLHTGTKERCCSRRCKNLLMFSHRYPGTFAEKFWAQVAIGAPDECWPWQGRRAPDGYGLIYVPETQRDTRAHIIAWYFAHGRWPLPGMNICHSCDRPPCTNERHLIEGTQAFNIYDAMAKGRLPKGERHGMSKLTDAQWEEILVLLQEDTLSRRQIAARYGIGHGKIASRLRRRGLSFPTKVGRRKTIQSQLYS